MNNGVLSASRVGVAAGAASYPLDPPFAPAAGIPEYPWKNEVSAVNPTYELVREALRQAGMDVQRFGTADWNPLGAIINPGDTVILKPNFVREFRESSEQHADCVITHGAVIRAVADYVYLALSGTGRIVIADAPHNDADFEAIRRIAGLSELQNFYRRAAGFDLEVCDLRPERASKIDGVIVDHVKLPGDPAGYVKVDLGRHSAFCEVESLCSLLYGSEYDTRELCNHHSGGRHEYLLSKTVLNADVVISLPKLKTHKKVGLTVNMKNLVGINGNKNWLPHHREGTPKRGGDQFADESWKGRIERRTVAQFKRFFPMLGPLRTWLAGPVKLAGKSIFGDTNNGTIRSGNWWGNDTTWRMVLDLNRILLYADADGRLLDRPVRRFFSVVDGIIGGEGNGPLDPTPRPAGLIIAGGNPVAVDLACARLMGLDFRRLPVLKRALDRHELPLAAFGFEEVKIASNQSAYDRRLEEFEGSCLNFEPHFGWKGHAEIGAGGSNGVADGDSITNLTRTT